MAMTITLTDEQEAAIAALVAAGKFSSIEEAVHAIINEGLRLWKARTGGGEK